MQQFLQNYDLCFLQEVWGSGFHELTAATCNTNTDPRWNVTPPFDLPPWRRPFLGQWLARSFLAEWIYTFYLHAVLETGGLYDMARPRATKCIYRSKHTFSKSRSKSLKGVEATLWTDIVAWDCHYNLLVFNTHLDPWIVENRKIQVNEIEDFIRTTIDQIQKTPELQTDDWSKLGVLVVGDFNVKAETEEYQALFVSRSWKDLVAMAKENNEEDDKQTEMTTYDKDNSLVSCSEDHGRIDYVFGIEEMDSKEFLSLRCQAVHVVRQSNGEELSDHYPIVVQIIPSR